MTHNSFIKPLKILFNKNSTFVGLDQFIYSSFNFLLLIYLSNNFELIDVGKYALIFSVQMVINMFLFCIIYEPLNIAKFSKNKRELFQILLIILFILNLFFISFFYYLINLKQIEINYFIIIYFNLFFIREFIKKINIQNLDSNLNFFISFIINISFLFYLFFLINDKFTNIFHIYFYLSFCEILFLIFFIPKIFILLKKINKLKILNIILDLKERSKSLLVFYFAKNVGNNFITLILSIFTSLELVGIYRIFQSILGVINSFLMYIENIYPYALSKIYKESKEKFKKYFVKNLFFILFIFSIVILFLNIFYENILFMLFSINLANHYYYLFLIMSISILCAVFNTFVRFYLRITDQLFKLNFSNNLQIILIFFMGPILIYFTGFYGLIFILTITLLNYLFFSLNIFSKLISKYNKYTL